MITAILDTNVFVRAAIRYPGSASSRAVDAYYDGKYQLVFSPATRDELLNVLTIPKIRARHGWSDDEVLRFLLTLLANAAVYPDERRVSPSITHDVTDTKFLALAEESGATYLVTQDRRHLLRLKRHGNTRIVTPAEFLKELDATSGH